MGPSRVWTSSGLLLAAVTLLVLAYALIIPLGAGLGPLDDHNLLTTLYANKLLSMDVFPTSGRFYPLDAQELNLIALLSTEPTAFYLFNTAQLFILAPIFLDLVRRLSGWPCALLAFALLLVTPGFASAWTRLQIPERDVLLYLVIFLWCYVQQQASGKWGWQLGALAAANIAMYYKEPVFLSVGTFALAGLLLARRTLRPSSILLHLLLLVSVGIFILTYYLVVYRYRLPQHIYGQPALPLMLTFARNIGSYLLSDPTIILGIPATMVWRTISILRGATSAPFADALLLAACAYLPFFFSFGISSPYYLLPAYAFALPAFGIYWRSIAQTNRSLFQVLICSVMIITLLSSVPLALFNLTFNKYTARNYDHAVDFLAKTLKTHDQKVSIYLHGVDRQAGIETFVSFKQFLLARNVPPALFSLEPMTGMRRSERLGDYMVITPFDTSGGGPSSFKRDGNWKLVWSSQSPLAVPDMSIRVAVKYAVVNFLFAGHAKDIGATEKYSYTPNYYIFVRVKPTQAV